MSSFVMYLRKSRADAEAEKRGRFETLAEHERQLRALCKERGITVSETYRELVSGESIAERHEFQRVLEKVKDPGCSGIVCHAIDRLGRGDPMEYGYVLSTLRFNGCSIVTPTRTYDTANPSDLQQLKLQMFVANVEFDHIRERLKDGSRRAVERGCYIGSHAPFGYDKCKLDNTPTLKPNAEAEAVRLMYELACSGLDKGKIARRLNADGIKTKNGKLWTAARVGATLANPIYKGLLRWGRYRVAQHSENGLIVKRREAGECSLHMGIHEPLVTEDEWDRANALAFEPVPIQRSHIIKNPLAGIIKCGLCGRAMIRQEVTGEHGQKYERLHHAYNTECQVKSISLPYVMDTLADVLVAIADDCEVPAPDESDTHELEQVERSLRTESKKLDKLLQLFYADAIDVQEFKTRREECRAVVADLRRRRDILACAPLSHVERCSTVHEVVNMLKDDSIPADARNTALKMLVERIDYYELDTAHKNRRIKLDVVLR